jgi:hypothetical protein
MADTARGYVFHVRRKNGVSLFLHPFTSPARLVGLLPDGVIVGRYGAEPVVEALTLLRNELYHMVDTAVRQWIGEQRFIPRFLITTGAFLAVYFITSYFIRDPLPMIDEVLLSVAASVIVFLWLGRRYARSSLATRRRVELRAAVDRISFTESAFVKRVEAVLHDNEAQEAEAIRGIVTPDEHALDAQERDEAVYFVGMLESRFDLKRLRREEKVLKRFLDAGRPPGGEQRIRRWLEIQKLDAPLYALYKGYKRTVQSLRS